MIAFFKNGNNIIMEKVILMRKTTSKVALGGLLCAIIIVMQLLKNISPFISGPIINTAMVIAIVELGMWWGIGFSVVVPITSLLFAPASAMTVVTALTNGMTLPVIMIGNVIFVLCAYFGKKHGYKFLIVYLILGAVLKWLFMWGCADLIIKPIFIEKLGETVAVINKIFSTLQLYSGLLSIILIFPILKALDKLNKSAM